MNGFYASSPETWRDVDNWEKVDNLSETSSSSDSSSDSSYSPNRDFDDDYGCGYYDETMKTPPVIKSLLEYEDDYISEDEELEEGEILETPKVAPETPKVAPEIPKVSPPLFDSWIEDKPEPFENCLLDYNDNIPELRIDYFDRCLYSKEEFNEYYCDNGKMWKFMHPKNVMKRQLIHDAFYYNPDLSNKKLNMLVDKLVAYTC
jgi:hypothetical protein